MPNTNNIRDPDDFHKWHGMKTNTHTCSEVHMFQPKLLAKKMKTFVHVFLLTASLPFVVSDHVFFFHLKF